MGRVLRTLGLSPQRPVFRATQQDPERVKRWRESDYPAIREEAAQVGATIYFADEAGIRSDYHSGTTWAPVGQTPVVKATGARHSLNMISAVTAQGLLRFCHLHRQLHQRPRSSTSPASSWPTPTGRSTSSSTATPPTAPRPSRSSSTPPTARCELFVLPAYSPQLNPDEWVWKNVKHDRIGKAGIRSAEDLRTKAERALRRLQRLPGLVCAFFSDPHIRYARAV